MNENGTGIPLVLHSYYRSSASYRVRIVLNLKKIPHKYAYQHLGKGEQRSANYLAINPQGLLPTVELGTEVLTQSLAICEYLEELYPTPPILPKCSLARAKVRSFAQAITSDIHPIQNLKVLNQLRRLGIVEEEVQSWAREVIAQGLDACEKLLPAEEFLFCFGDDPGLGDICLVPQLVNARRFGVDVKWPRISSIERNCLELEAFRDASPSYQADKE